MRHSLDELHAALNAGDPEKVRNLIASGVDIQYTSRHGYHAMLDAVHGRDIARDSKLMDLLGLLISERVDMNGISRYSESPLRVLSREGRFDAVRLLLNNGADRTQLELTPLMEAVALGSAADVQRVLADAPDLEARDWWSRTAWLIAILTGDMEKERLLRGAGADINARGRCESPPLVFAVTSHKVQMLIHLIESGQNVDQADEFGGTALIRAAETNDLECARTLLEAGADLERKAVYTAMGHAETKEMARLLLEAGANPADITTEGRRALLNLPTASDDLLGAVSKEEFERCRTQRFGTKNPERMNCPFWEAMIRSGAIAYTARQRFGSPIESVDLPVWCADRFGQSLTILPDGRIIQIGGEHEDFYDPDFCIYNDVFVHQPDGSITIYGYPEANFPPTDFHSATLIGDQIYVIGSLGYRGTRRLGVSPVYRIDTNSFKIVQLLTQGSNPGWISGHRAALVGDDGIKIWSGSVSKEIDGDEELAPNKRSYILNVRRLAWSIEPD